MSDTPMPAAPAILSFVDEALMQTDMAIDLTDLTREMQEHASKFVFYAANSVRAKAQHELQKRRFETIEAALENEHRTAMKEENPKTTESQIHSAVITDSRYRRASERVGEAHNAYRMAEVAERGFEQRKDMLLQIARDAARESAGPLRVASNASAKERAGMLLETMSAHASIAR